MRYIAVGLILVGLFAANAAEFLSPNCQVRFIISSDADALRYTVKFQAKAVIEDSSVVFSIDGVDLTRGVKLGKPEDRTRATQRERYAEY